MWNFHPSNIVESKIDWKIVKDLWVIFYTHIEYTVWTLLMCAFRLTQWKFDSVDVNNHIIVKYVAKLLLKDWENTMTKRLKHCVITAKKNKHSEASFFPSIDWLSIEYFIVENLAKLYLLISFRENKLKFWHHHHLHNIDLLQ